VRTRESTLIGTKALLKAARHAPLVGAEEEVRLARLAQLGSKPAFEALVRAHLRLVLSMAHEFASYSLPLDELVSEGLLGLVEATRRYDAERGVRLAAYATWWIRAYMRRFTIANRRIVRTPSSRHGRKLLANLRKTQRALQQETGEAPDRETVANVLGVGVRDVDEMEAALSGRDVPCGPEEPGIDADIESPEALVAAAEEQHASGAALHGALSLLNQRERRIVEERYLTESSASLASLGRELGLSRERVRQIEHRAQDKMRDAMLAAVAF
jgi:RNA polymerase sigma-32 factor